MDTEAWSLRLGAPGGTWVASLIAVAIVVIVVREILVLREGPAAGRRAV